MILRQRCFCSETGLLPMDCAIRTALLTLLQPEVFELASRQGVPYVPGKG